MPDKIPHALPLPGSHPGLQALRSTLVTGVIRRQTRNPADLEDPTRFDQVNQALFAQSTTGAALQPWVDPGPGIPGTATMITQQFLQGFRQFIAANPPARGEASPTADNATVQGRAFNRRVEMSISRAP